MENPMEGGHPPGTGATQVFQLLPDMPPEIEWEGEGILWLHPSFARQPGRLVSHDTQMGR